MFLRKKRRESATMQNKEIRIWNKITGDTNKLEDAKKAKKNQKKRNIKMKVNCEEIALGK